MLMSTFFDARFCYMSGILRGNSWEYVESAVTTYGDSLIDYGQIIKEPVAKRSSSMNSSYLQFIQSKQNDSQENTVETEICAYKALVFAGRPSHDSTPSEFWKCHKSKFPILARAAFHLLSCPQSSAIVERLFSSCGALVNASRRNRIKSSTLNNPLMNCALATLKLGENEAAETEIFDEDGEEDEFEPNDDSEDQRNDDFFEENLANFMSF